MEEAGADALELNLYHLAVDPRRTAAGMEATDLELIAAVRTAITIPLAVKLSPYYSAIANFAARAREHGADGRPALQEAVAHRALDRRQDVPRRAQRAGPVGTGMRE